MIVAQMREQLIVIVITQIYESDIMSNTVFILGIGLLCYSIDPLPLWTIITALCFGIMTDLFSIDRPR